MNKVPFEYGTIAENQYFIDRIADRKELKTFLGGGVNVMLISPRRWGKSSLVKAAMEELKKERTDIRVCYLDAFKIFTEEDFYSKFTSAVLKGILSPMQQRLNEAIEYVRHLSPSITVSSDPVNAVDFKLNFNSLPSSPEEILNLPEKLAKKHNVQVIVCIDEFQQLARLSCWKKLEGTMRSVWQHQSNTNYCLYGSKRHMMMDIFGNSHNPFYRFGQLISLKKIAREYWIPYIHDSFENYGKHIDAQYINRICDLMQCHSWYMQQFCFFIWTHTDKEVTDEIFDTEYNRLIDSNSDMFMADINNMAASQIAFLKAVCSGETHFNAQEVVRKYNLGSPRIITKNKQLLVERDIIEKNGDGYRCVDPLFELWFRREFV